MASITGKEQTNTTLPVHAAACCETGLTHTAAQTGGVLQHNDTVLMQVFTLNLTIRLFDNFFTG